MKFEFESFEHLKSYLADLAMFSPSEIDQIVSTCGKSTLGNAIVACEILGIRLDGSDIDTMVLSAMPEDGEFESNCYSTLPDTI